MARPRIGDILEFRMPQGAAYAVYTHKHAQYGALIRVFRKIHEVRPNDTDEVLADDVQFLCFFPLGAAIARNIVSTIATVPLPAKFESFPVFRTGVAEPTTGKVRVRWFWDGVAEWPVGEITSEQRKMPIRSVWNDTLLIERLVAGWTAQSDPS